MGGKNAQIHHVIYTHTSQLSASLYSVVSMRSLHPLSHNSEYSDLMSCPSYILNAGSPTRHVT
jgi:hypothetical protein